MENDVFEKKSSQDPSWADLGFISGSFLLILYWFLYYFVQIDVFEKKWSQEASWDDLGSIWVAKRGPRRGLLGGKLGGKRVKKDDAKKGFVLVGQRGGSYFRRWVTLGRQRVRGRLGGISPLVFRP